MKRELTACKCGSIFMTIEVGTNGDEYTFMVICDKCGYKGQAAPSWPLAEDLWNKKLKI